MDIRSVRSVRFPKPSASHFDHFNIIGLETFVDRADAGHGPRCDGQFAGQSAGASKCQEKRRYWPSLKPWTDPVAPTHAASPCPAEESPSKHGCKCWVAAWSRAC